MHLVCSIYVGLLFFVLTPGILLSLPKKGSKYMVAATHALVFAAIYYFTHRMVWRIEGFAGVSMTCPPNEYSKNVVVKTPTGTKNERQCKPIPAKTSAPVGIQQKCGDKLTFDTNRGSWGCN